MQWWWTNVTYEPMLYGQSSALISVWNSNGKWVDMSVRMNIFSYASEDLFSWVQLIAKTSFGSVTLVQVKGALV